METREILKRLEVLQVTVSVENDRIRLRPSSRIPSALVEEIRKNKKGLLDYLRQEETRIPQCRWNDSTIDEGAQDELEAIERSVFERGYVLFWSSILEDCIAFYHLERDLRHIPQGFVPHSVQELWYLFGEKETFLSRKVLRRIHEAKKTGAVITGVKEDQS